MNCKKCGSPLNADDQFCQNCGEAVNSQSNNEPVIISNSPSMEIGPTMNDNSQPVELGPIMNNNEQPMGMDPMMNDNNQPMGMDPMMNDNNQSMGMDSMMNNNNQSMGMDPMMNNNSQPMGMDPMMNNNSQPMGMDPMMNNNSQPMNNANNKKLYMVIGIAAVIVIATIIIAVVAVNKKETPSATGGDAQNVAQQKKSVYKVTYEGFIFEIPDNLLYDTTSGLKIGDAENTWLLDVTILKNANFAQYKTNKAKLPQALKQQGFSATEAKLEKYGELEFLSTEISKGGENAILAYSSINSMNMVAVFAFNEANEFDYSLLETISPIISSAKVSEDTIKSIKSDKKADIVKIASELNK